MAEVNGTEPDHVSSFVDDTHGPSDHHKDWAPVKTTRRRVALAPCFENDCAPANRPNRPRKQQGRAKTINRRLDLGPFIECDCGCTKPSSPAPPPSEKP